MERVRRRKKAVPRERDPGAGYIEPRADPRDVVVRLAEKHARDVLDDRTAAEKWLGDPLSWESARAVNEPTEDDIAAASLFAWIVGSRLRSICDG